MFYLGLRRFYLETELLSPPPIRAARKSESGGEGLLRENLSSPPLHIDLSIWRGAGGEGVSERGLQLNPHRHTKHPMLILIIRLAIASTLQFR